jgi:alkylated DNA repair dioxygenase AlkB
VPLDGFVYRPELVTETEEADLVDWIRAQPLERALYLQYTANRRILSFGGRYDFSRSRLEPASPVPEFLHPIRRRMAELMDVPADALSHVLIAEYQRGTQLGWHRDVPDFELVGGLSLHGPARLRFRPHPHRKGDRTSFKLDLEPRAAYALRGPARWGWQHAISPTPGLRFSITFRTLRARSEYGR